MTPLRLKELLSALPHPRIGVIGDFCVDSYFIVDASASEPSLETGLRTRPVREQRSTLGGAGNVVANLAAMGVRNISAFSVIAPDSIGSELLRLLTILGIDSSGLIVQPSDWQTHSYLKPIVDQQECERYDFGIFNALSAQSCQSLLQKIRESLPALDVLVINQQFEKGIHIEAFRSGLQEILEANPKVPVLVDSRHFAEAYPSGMHKLNVHEATRLNGIHHLPTESISRQEAVDSALKLHARWRRPVFVTRGRDGCLVVDDTGVHEVPGLHLINRTDPVGAGDSMVAGIAACLGVRATLTEAVTFGNFVAGVTVQKLQQTGTASPDEILAIGSESDYVYRPELAQDARQATYIAGTAIEVCEELPQHFALCHAIFDHDGTISTLRQGWEIVMEEMMMKAILGEIYHTVDRGAFETLRKQSRAFIDKTTGIQTLKQMSGISAMVRDAGYVRSLDVLDAHGYKRQFNDRLMALISERKRRLLDRELGVEDLTVKNAVELLHALRKSGIRLYLASGTDQEDVILEAETLGYAELFEGRIYGANQDITHDAKRVVLKSILQEIGTKNAASIVTFGDGPVEIREAHKLGALTVGVASNEIQRFGLNLSKRSRLIQAGANIVVPDYSQLGSLLRILHIEV